MASTVQLLGVPAFVQNGRREDVPPGQVLLLIAHLAYCERWRSRPAVAGLFWPDKTERAARHSLNQLLYTCRKLPWTVELEVERSRLRWVGDSDVAQFRNDVAQGNWRDAVRGYRGDFLASIDVAVSAEFETWLDEARRELYTSWRDAALAHADALIAVADHTAAAELLERVLHRDELAEDVLQRLLRCSFELGEGARRQALRRFERFARTLRNELSVEPMADTVTLATTLKAEFAPPGANPVAPSPSAPAPPRTAPLRNVPSFGTGFIGRDAERADLDALLRRPDARLITLLGPGGVGKTRLAAHVAAEQARHFVDGAVYVPLAALDDAELVPTALLAALAVEGSPHVAARRQVLDHLADREALLVFDNFEPVIDAAEMLQGILETSPASRILVTSREALTLPGEHLYDLPGLSFPASVDEISEECDAVRLFLRSAQRLRPRFRLDDGNRPHVFELCRLLEGSPLGLELAASWLRILPVEEIVREIHTNLDFLAVERVGVPPRHRSLRAVFDSSWRLLADEEQRALARLSVFRGGFDRVAARLVAEVPARTLLSLVNKSLLQRTPAGRFERHATVQRFSAEMLPADEQQRWRLRHATHVATLAERFREAVNGLEEQAWLERIRADLDNVRAALNHALATGATELGMRVAVDLREFWYRAGLVAEANAAYAALRAAPQGAVAPLLRARCYEASGHHARLAGDFAGARAHFERGLQLFAEVGDERSRVNTLNGLGIAAYLDGDPAAARRAWHEGLVLAERLGDPHGTANLSNSLGFLAKDDEDYAAMANLFRKALAIYQDLGHRLGILSATSNLGFAALHQEDFDTSLRYQREALAMALELEHDDSIVRCLEDLAALAAASGEPALALQLAATTAARRRELGLPIDPHDEASLAGYLELARADLDEASARSATQRGRAMDLRQAARAVLEPEPRSDRTGTR